jgi:hypothetical protein
MRRCAQVSYLDSGPRHLINVLTWVSPRHFRYLRPHACIQVDIFQGRLLGGERKDLPRSTDGSQTVDRTREDHERVSCNSACSMPATTAASTNC